MVLLSIIVPNDAVDIPIYQNLYYYRFDEQHAYTIY